MEQDKGETDLAFADSDPGVYNVHRNYNSTCMRRHPIATDAEWCQTGRQQHCQSKKHPHHTEGVSAKWKHWGT